MPMRTDPYARTPAKLSKTGKTFALVIALHVGLLWLAQAVWISEPATAVREVVAAQLIQELRAPEPLKPMPKTPPPQAMPALVAQISIPPSLTQSALPAITSAPASTTPTVQATAAPAPAPMPVSVRQAAPAKIVPPTRVGASCELPHYPAASVRLQEEGLVKLSLLISEAGKVLEASVKESSGYKRLDAAALAALSLCSYRPGTVDGKPQSSWVIQPYNWKLE